jgi:hypothetical protein
MVKVGLWALGVVCVLFGGIGWGQAAVPLVIQHGTAVPVKLLEQVSSSEGKAGSVVRMEAAADVVVDGMVVVRRGAPLTATLTAVQKKAKTVPDGRVSLHMSDVEMANGARLAVDGTRSARGGHVNSKVYKGLVIASLVALSTAGAVTALLIRGEEIVLPEGIELEASVVADTTLDRAKFMAEPKGNAAAVPVPAAGMRIETSAGDGSVFVDGKFAGEAPFTADIRPGVRKIEVDRDGYKRWEQKVVVEGAPLKLVVKMEKKKVKG